MNWRRRANTASDQGFDATWATNLDRPFEDLASIRAAHVDQDVCVMGTIDGIPDFFDDIRVVIEQVLQFVVVTLEDDACGDL